MGGGGGGSAGGGMKTTNTNDQTGPSPVIAPKLENLTNNAWEWYAQHMNAPDFMSTVAQQSPYTTTANSALFNTGQYGVNNPAFTGANEGRQFALNTIGGQYLNPESNPAYQGWLDASFRPQAENFRDILAPGIDAKFSAAGRPGSGAHFDTTMRGVQDLNRAQADAAAKSALGLYQGERANQFTAANLLPTYQNMDLASQNARYRDISAMQAAGAGQDAYAQKLKDDEVAKYIYESQGQPEWLLRASQIMQGIYPGGTKTGTAQSQAEGGGGGDGGAQTAQLAGAGIAAAASIAAAFI